VPVAVSPDGRGQLWATTVGMQQFGLPNLEVTGVPQSLGKSIGTLVSAVAQKMLALAMTSLRERAREDEPIGLEDELAIAHEDAQRANGVGGDWEGENGETRVRLAFAAPPRDASADTRAERDTSLRIVAPEAASHDHSEWLHDAVDALGGRARTQRVVPGGTPAMAQAHERAMASLPEARARFTRGLALGETLYVKHAFAIPSGGSEFMWIAVTRWASGRIAGRLANRSSYRADLRAGAPIEVLESGVFDWMVCREEGQYDGGFTIGVVERLATS